jgi:hypothetical protein
MALCETPVPMPSLKNVVVRNPPDSLLNPKCLRRKRRKTKKNPPKYDTAPRR